MKWNLQAIVINALRRAYRTYPVYKEILNENKEEYFIKSKSGLPMRRVRWQCVKCLKKVDAKTKVVDHISPVVDPTIGFVNFDTYVIRLFCDKSNLQILCKPCHSLKSLSEIKVRKVTRASKKKRRRK